MDDTKECFTDEEAKIMIDLMQLQDEVTGDWFELNKEKTGINDLLNIIYMSMIYQIVKFRYNFIKEWNSNEANMRLAQDINAQVGKMKELLENDR